MTLSDRIRTALPHMSANDREVLKNMRDRAKAYGGQLSSRQLEFVEIILKRSTPHTKPIGGLERINEMFDKASGKLNEPIVHAIVAEEEVTLTGAKAGSHNPGFIYVQVKGGRYVGKISPQGTFLPVREAPVEVLDTLRAFAAEPFQAVLAYGQATKRCGLCNRKLKNALSVELGIGPICRANYGI